MLDARTVEWIAYLPPGEWEVILDPDDWLLDTQSRGALFSSFQGFLAYPNPSASGFTLSGSLEGVLPERGEVTIYDVQGRHIRTLDLGSVSPGPVQTVWNGLADDGGRVPAGMYFARFQVGYQQHTQRLVVIP